MTFFHKSKKPGILIISAEDQEKKELAAFLTAGGYCVDTAATPEEGIDLLGNKSFDIFIIDQTWDEMQGTQFFTLIAPSCSSALKILVSNDPFPDLKARASGCGVDCIITRPIHFDALEEILTTKGARHV